mmetsp:Transcript_56066/g.164646  ORF Transcript_56066/g.164646 Transcript_56066/m.164646 type:complete len:161 (+) Transcript_56066:76-558(+)
MALKFYGISIPISIVLASAYFYWITQKSAARSDKSKAGKQFKDLDIVTHKMPSTCGIKAGKDDLLHVHYSGYLKSNGKMFESTRENSEPYVFKLGTCNDKNKPECIKGFQQGVTGMCAGEKRKVTVPPRLAFGKTGRVPDIPADDSIIYHIEMVDIDSFK